MSEVARAFAAKLGVTFAVSCGRCHYGRLIGEDTLPTYCTCPRGVAEKRHDDWQREKDREEMEETQRANLMRRLVLPDSHKDYTFDTHPLAGRKQPCHREYLDVMDWFAHWDSTSGRGLILTGDYGTGKTGCIVAGMKTLIPRAVREKWSMRFITTLDLLLLLQSGFSDGSYQQTLDEYSKVHLLALDDLGAESESGWRRDQYLAILGRRYDAGLPLLATTNYAAHELKQRLGPRIYSRYQQRCDVFTFQGPDLRETEE